MNCLRSNILLGTNNHAERQLSTEDRKLFGLRLRYPFRYLQPAACAQRVGEHLDHEPDLFPRFVVLQVVLDVKDPKLTADRLSQKMAEQIDKYGDKCMPPKMFIMEKGPDESYSHAMGRSR